MGEKIEARLLVSIEFSSERAATSQRKLGEDGVKERERVSEIV